MGWEGVEPTKGGGDRQDRIEIVRVLTRDEEGTLSPRDSDNARGAREDFLECIKKIVICTGSNKVLDKR